MDVSRWIDLSKSCPKGITWDRPRIPYVVLPGFSPLRGEVVMSTRRQGAGGARPRPATRLATLFRSGTGRGERPLPPSVALLQPSSDQPTARPERPHCQVPLLSGRRRAWTPVMRRAARHLGQKTVPVQRPGGTIPSHALGFAAIVLESATSNPDGSPPFLACEIDSGCLGATSCQPPRRNVAG